jgi:hypothetical protein
MAVLYWPSARSRQCENCSASKSRCFAALNLAGATLENSLHQDGSAHTRGLG